MRNWQARRRDKQLDREYERHVPTTRMGHLSLLIKRIEAANVKAYYESKGITLQ